MEKNHVVEFFPAKKSDYDGELFDIPLNGKELTLKRMVDTASRDNEAAFWKYRADSNNCQRWTRDMIERNGLLPEVEEEHHKVQDAKALADSLHPVTRGIPNFITDAAAVADRIISGDGVRMAKQKAIRAALFGH